MQQFHSFDDLLGDYLTVMPDDPKITGAASLFETKSGATAGSPMFESMYSTEDYLRALDIVKKWKVPSKLSPMVVGALALVLAACSAGKLVESRPFARKAMQVMTSLSTRNPDEMTPEDTVKVNDTIEMAQDTEFAPADPEAPVEKPMYAPGETIQFKLLDLKNVGFELSTNESIKTLRMLDSLATVERADMDFLAKIRVSVNVVDPEDPDVKGKFDEMGTSTAYTTGLSSDMLGNSAINIYVVPIPNLKSLANVLSHEIKHPFPVIAANILRLNPRFRGAVPAANSIAERYGEILDCNEHVERTGKVWTVAGNLMNPVDILRSMGINWFNQK